MSKRDELAAVLECAVIDYENTLTRLDDSSIEGYAKAAQDAVLAWLGGQFDEGLRAGIGRALHARGGCDCGGWFYDEADAAIATMRARLGLHGAAQDAQEGAQGSARGEVGSGSGGSANGAQIKDDEEKR